MPSAAIAFLAGILAVQQLPALPGRGWLWLLLPVAALAWRWRRLYPLAFLLAGAAWTVLQAGTVLTQRLPPTLEGKDVAVEGRVASIPRVGERALRFDFDVDAYAVPPGVSSVRLPRRVRLRWYDTGRRLGVGERWRLRVRLKRPSGFVNAGGFDYEAWLFRHRLRAVGYVRADPGNARLAPPTLGAALDRYRARLAAQIGAALSGRPAAGIVAALAVGVRDGIDTPQWDVLRRTGTSHLVAISGLHVGLVAGLAYGLAAFAWRRLGELCLRLAAPRAGALAALLAAAAYAALAGFSVPTQRALVMAAVCMGAVLAGRRASAWPLLASALLAVLVYDPLAVMAAGFWLSFAAVAVIVLTLSKRVQRVSPPANEAEQGGAVTPPAEARWPGVLASVRRRLLQWGRLQLALGIGLAPLLLAFFQQASLVAPLANAVAIPAIGLLVVPLALLGVLAAGLVGPHAAGPLFAAAAAVIEFLWPALSWLAGLEHAVAMRPAPPLVVLAAGLVGVALLLSPRARALRAAGLVLLLPLVLYGPPQPRAGEAWLTVLDVGQGLAAVVRTRGHTLVYDTGARFGPDFDLGAAAVVPYLRHAGVERVDTLVVSHGDVDHIGGTASLLAQVPVAARLSSVADRIPAAVPCRAGQRWDWDGVRFEMLSPSTAAPAAGNDASCVLRVESAFGAVLLTGDIEAAAERELVRRAGRSLRADVLVVPHHGSRTSSTAAFVDAVAPAVAVVSAGYRNRYRHPHDEVIARFVQRGVPVHNTADAGAVSVRLTAAGLRLERRRETHARYWQRRRDGPRTSPAATRDRPAVRPSARVDPISAVLLDCVGFAKPFPQPTTATAPIRVRALQVRRLAHVADTAVLGGRARHHRRARVDAQAARGDAQRPHAPDRAARRAPRSRPRQDRADPCELAARRDPGGGARQHDQAPRGHEGGARGGRPPRRS